MEVSLETAQGVIARALEAAGAQSVNVAVAVVDAAGNLRAAVAMDRTGFMSMEAAIRKARTAANMGHSTQAISIMASKDPLMQAALHAEPGLLLLPGGVPLMDGDRAVGAVGIAGGHYSQDQAIVEYALQQQ